MGHIQFFVISMVLNETLCSDIRTKLVCDDRIMNIDCSVDFTISITRANYGRFSLAVCNEYARQDVDIHCESIEKTTEFLKKR